MMQTEPAWAKLNLTLDILGKRPDGYHDLRMVMQSIGLQDTITVETEEQPGIRVASNFHFLPCDESNIAAKAAIRFFEATGLPRPGLSISMEKNIPVCAGMAGGSSDGAAVLRILRRTYCPELPRERLEEIGALVGSDVPYCVRGGTALAEGRGERLTDLPPLPPCYFVICKPSFAISTPELFSLVHMRRFHCRPDTAGMISALTEGDLAGVAHRLYNVFEDVLPRKYAQVFDIKRALLDHGAMASSMSGSGPTVFGMFSDKERATAARDALLPLFPQTFLCHSVGKSV